MNKVPFEMNKIHNCDCLEFMKQVPDDYFQLIYIDPPYFEVKGDFDFIWKDFNEYLTWMGELAKEFKRVLADNGSIFLWGNSKKIAYKQIIFDKHFNLENNLVWEKIDSIQFQYYSPDLARRFNTHTERCLFYSNEVGMTGLEAITEEYIKPLNSFSLYLRDEFKKAKVTNKEIARLFLSKTGGTTGCVSNWLNGDNIITREQYLKIRSYLNDEYLKREYEDLKREYEDLRRPFLNSSKITDVIRGSQESNITRKYKHPTQKPYELSKELIRVTTNRKSNVFIPFVGSGTEAVACKSLGLEWCGTELEADYVAIANKRLEKVQGSLF